MSIAQQRSTTLVLPVLNTSKESLEEVLHFLLNNPNADDETKIHLIRQALTVAAYLNEDRLHCKMLNHLGSIYLEQGQFTTSQDAFEEAVLLAKGVADPELISPTLNNVGLVFKAKSDYIKALDYFFKALSYNSIQWNPYIYNNIGLVMEQQGEDDKSLDYYSKALQYALENEDEKMVLVTHINIGSVYQKIKQSKIALEFYNKGLQRCKSNGKYLIQEAMFHQNIGGVYAHLDETTLALSHYQQAMKIYQDHQHHYHLMSCQVELGEFYQMSNFTEAITYFQKAKELAIQFNFKKELMAILEQLCTCYQELGQRDHLLEHLQILNQLQKNYYQNVHKNFMDQMISLKEAQIEILIDKNERILHQNKLLEQSNLELEQYAYIIAHDLKEPLRSINSFSTLLRRNHPELEENSSSTYFEFIQENTLKINTKLDDLLKYVSLKMPLEEVLEVDVERSFLEVMDQFKNQLNDIEISYEDLPQIEVVPDHLRCILHELMENSLAYAHPKRKLMIHFSCYEDEKGYWFSFQDNGKGIAPEFQEQVFKIFTQLERSPNSVNTGIGLAICKKICNFYRQDIWIESNEWDGCTVCFRWEA